MYKWFKLWNVLKNCFVVFEEILELLVYCRLKYRENSEIYKEIVK